MWHISDSKKETEIHFRFGKKKHYLPGMVVLDRHSTGKHAIYVLDGEVRAMLMSMAGEDRLLAYIGKGGTVGEHALFSEQKSRSNLIVETTQESTVLEMTREDMVRNLECEPRLALFLMRSASMKISNLLATLQCASHLSTPISEQIARVIFMLYHEASVESDDEVRITHDQISKIIGRSRVAVTNAMKNLQSDGLLDVHRGRIKILDHIGLQKLVGESQTTEISFRAEQKTMKLQPTAVK